MTTRWNGWFGLGGTIHGQPAVVYPTAGTIDIYVRGMDDRLWQKWWDGTRWNPSDADWAQHDDGDFRLASSPCVISLGADFRDVYGLRKDGQVCHKMWDGKKWSGWFTLGGGIKSAPAVVQPTVETLDIYARDTKDRLVQKWWDGSKWNPSDSTWAPHEDGGFRITSSPSVISNGLHFREVFARGTDGAVCHKFWNGNVWSQWFGLGGQITSAPSAVLLAPASYEIYARGTDGRLWQKSWSSKKQAWWPSDLGWSMHHAGNDRIGGAPAAVTVSEFTRDVYVRGLDGSVYHKFSNTKRMPYAPVIRADAAKSAKIDNAANAQVGKSEPGVAIAVIKDGQIVHLAGYGIANLVTKAPVTSETMFHMASCGKQLTGIGIIMLQHETKLAYSDPIGKHIPKLKSLGPQVTLERLLHHTSDILDLYNTAAGAAALAMTSSFPTNADVITTYAKMKSPFDPNPAAPGDTYVYSNSEYDLLGSVIESVSGKSYVDFFRTRVFEPFGMNDSFSLPDTSRMGDPNRAIGYNQVGKKYVAQPASNLDAIVGSGSFYSSVFDLCAYEEALAKNYLVTADDLKKTAYKIDIPKDGLSQSYGFGWVMGSFLGMPFAEHTGSWTGFISHIRRYTAKSLSIYVLSNNATLNLTTLVQEATKAYK